MIPVVGIDPGLHGGIAALESQYGAAVVFPMPIQEGSTGRDEYDVDRIIRLLQALISDGPIRSGATVVVERQQPMPPFLVGGKATGAVAAAAGGSIGNYNRGLARGLFWGIVKTLGIEPKLVGSREWQAVMLGKTRGDQKARSVAAATRLFPAASLLPKPRSRKASDGMSDALLIAAYGRRRWPAGLFDQPAGRLEHGGLGQV